MIGVLRGCGDAMRQYLVSPVQRFFANHNGLQLLVVLVPVALAVVLWVYLGTLAVWALGALRRLLVYVWLIPVVYGVEAVRTKNTRLQRKWVKQWIVCSPLLLLEVSPLGTDWIPYFSVIQFVLLVLLLLPPFSLAQLLYDTVINPFLNENQRNIEEGFSAETVVRNLTLLRRHSKDIIRKIRDRSPMRSPRPRQPTTPNLLNSSHSNAISSPSLSFASVGAAPVLDAGSGKGSPAYMPHGVTHKLRSVSSPPALALAPGALAHLTPHTPVGGVGGEGGGREEEEGEEKADEEGGGSALDDSGVNMRTRKKKKKKKIMKDMEEGIDMVQSKENEPHVAADESKGVEQPPVASNETDEKSTGETAELHTADEAKHERLRVASQEIDETDEKSTGEATDPVIVGDVPSTNATLV
jgi:hypothetical protein